MSALCVRRYLDPHTVKHEHEARLARVLGVAPPQAYERGADGRRSWWRRALDLFVAPFEVVPFGAEGARVYGRIRADLERRGRPIGGLDLMIAAHALSLGATVVKQSARKIRRLYNETILAGFAGSAADSFALFSRFESKLEQYRGNLERASVELARDWRTDRYLRRLEAMLIVADRKSTFLLSGTGDLIEPDDGVVAVGSGGAYAMAAARALVKHSPLTARQIAEESMRIAADICIYTNPNLTIEEL